MSSLDFMSSSQERFLDWDHFSAFLSKICTKWKKTFDNLGNLMILSPQDPVCTMFFVPDGEGMYTRGSSSQAIHLMGQSLFIIAQLLTAGLLHVNELDPIRRYLPSYNRPRKGGSRYSAFQVRNFQIYSEIYEKFRSENSIREIFASKVIQNFLNYLNFVSIFLKIIAKIVKKRQNPVM